MAQSHTTTGSQSEAKLARVGSLVRSSVIAMRPWQWAKNLFVLPPLIFGGKMFVVSSLMDTALAFVALCAVASSIYLINDIVDLESDRTHPKKSQRPIAAGALSIPFAIGLATVLAGGGLMIAAHVGRAPLYVTLAYIGISLSYCFALKTILFLDCIAIATGFVVRVVLGAVTAGVNPSHWLLICTFLLALFLAFSKRRAELQTLTTGADVRRPVLIGYSDVALLDQINAILLAATITSYMLYSVSPDTVARFGTHNLVYGSVFVIYGLFRYLYLSRKTSSVEDPALALIGDIPMLITVFGWSIYSACVIYIFGSI